MRRRSTNRTDSIVPPAAATARRPPSRLGRLATDFTRQHLLGRTVSLELDAEQRDRYGRLLAYVWLDERTLFNAEIVRAGYATAYTVAPNVRYATWFRALEREARAA